MLFFGALVFIIIAVLIFNYLDRRLKMQTVIALLGNDKDLSPAHIIALSEQRQDSDLRKGVLCLSSALASIVFGLIMGNADYEVVQISFISMAIFPALIGLTYLYFYLKQNQT
jgi:hypothetical protein